MSNLVVHKMKLHGQTTPIEATARTVQADKFSCKLCGEKFPKKASLNLHEEQKHNLIKSKSSSSRRSRMSASTEIPTQVRKDFYRQSVQKVSSILLAGGNLQHQLSSSASIC